MLQKYNKFSNWQHFSQEIVTFCQKKVKNWKLLLTFASETIIKKR